MAQTEEPAIQKVKFYQTGTHTIGNRLMDESGRSVQASAERSNAITSGHRACQGCGEALGARYALDAAMRAAAGKLVAVNATGCLEVFTTPYPETSWQIPWLHSLFGNAPAVAAGVAAGLRRRGLDKVKVVAQGGDGGTVDIGFGCLSGMFERKRGLYEHRRSALFGNAAHRTDGHDAGPGQCTGQRLRHRQEPAADRHGP
jgi:pyruvate ferredoxin oxidoreductase beta subunit